MTRNTADCEIVSEIGVRLLAGDPVNEPDVQLHGTHLSQCEQCLAEAQFLELIDGEDNQGPLAPLDDVARRRMIVGVLDKASQSSTSIPKDTFAANISPSRPKRSLLIASAVAASVLFLLAFVLLVDDSGTQQISITAPSTHTDFTGHLVLASGSPTISDRPIAIGEKLLPDSPMSTNDGSLVMQLPTGIKVALGPDTKAVAERLDRSSLRIRLDKGTLHAATEPGRTGPAFLISTGDGVVHVTGTIFSVSVDNEGTVVTVHRGRVAIEDSVTSTRRHLQHGESTRLGDPRTWRGITTQDRAVWDRNDVFEMLDGTSASSLVLQSEPRGARVRLDGTLLGKTPLSLSVRPGHRRLEIALRDWQQVRERIDISAGETLHRSFQLQPAGTHSQAKEEPEDEPEGTGSGKAAPASGRPSSTALLARAQGFRQEKKWREAARTYRVLIRNYPNSGEARASHVSLGQIYLVKLGKPGSALRSFDAYLSTPAGGPLTLEALLGRSRALGKLGRTAEESTSLQRFLSRFPGSIQAPAVRRRLEAIVKTDDRSENLAN